MSNQYTKIKYTDNEIKEIISLYRKGVSFTRILKILHRQKNTIKKILIEHGVFDENRNDFKFIITDKIKLENYEKRGVSGIKGSYHLDHKFSKIKGFKNNISPEIIGNIKNLEFIPWKENLLKGTKCSINKTELLNKI